MDKDIRDNIRKTITRYSNEIDNLEMTKKLIQTSNVLCFTTMDRSPEETVSIEFSEHNADGSKMETNGVIKSARDAMVQYLDSKISELNEKIDKIILKGF